jgi:hypothetical protein
LVLLALLSLELAGIGYYSYQRWSMPGWHHHTVLDGHPKEIWAIAFSRDGETLGVMMEGGEGKVWEVATGKERGELRGLPDLVTLGEGRVGFIVDSFT